jgi:hypothetical protein
MTSRPAAGGGRWITVSPARLDRWLAGFVERHGPSETVPGHDEVVITAADGAVATVEVPFPPLAGDLAAHALQDRTVGVLLVRLGGYAAGVFVGSALVSSKVGSRQVHGRSAAGGWSQQRFARRREGQASVALQTAADVAVRILLAQPLDAVVVGGERTAVDAVLADRRLAPLLPLVTGRLLDVPDPKLAVLQKAPFRDVWIKVVDPPG